MHSTVILADVTRLHIPFGNTVHSRKKQQHISRCSLAHVGHLGVIWGGTIYIFNKVEYSQGLFWHCPKVTGLTSPAEFISSPPTLWELTTLLPLGLDITRSSNPSSRLGCIHGGGRALWRGLMGGRANFLVLFKPVLLSSISAHLPLLPRTGNQRCSLEQLLACHPNRVQNCFIPTK